MHSDKFLPLTSSPFQREPIERYQWVSFLGSLLLHGLLLLALSWFLVRPVPPTAPMEIEVQIESQPPLAAQVQRHNSREHRSRHSTRLAQARPHRVIREVTRVVPLQEMQVALKDVKRRRVRSAGTVIKLASSKMTAPSSLDKPGRSAEGAAGRPGNAAAPGPAWQATLPASLPPRLAFAGRQSSIAQATQSRSGEASTPGPTQLTGSTPAVQSLTPEFRHASRPFGSLASQGGSQQPSAGLEARTYEARQGSWQAVASSGQAVARSAGHSAGRSGISMPSNSATPGSGRPLEGTSNGLGKNLGTALAAAPGIGSSAAKIGVTGSGTSHRGAGLGSTSGSGRPLEGTSNGLGKDLGTALAAAPGTGSGAGKMGAIGTGAGHRGGGAGFAGKGGGSSAAPGEQRSGSLIGSSGPGIIAAATSSGMGRAGPAGSIGMAGGNAVGSNERNAAGLQLASSTTGSSMRDSPGVQRAQWAGDVSPMNASFETAENTHNLMQVVATANGSARMLADRYTAATIKTASPTHFCEIPMMMAGFSARPIPKGLDSIMPSASAMSTEFPPQHMPGNQMPVYPMGAIMGNLQGKVVLRAQVLTNGEVGQILVRESSGAAILDEAAAQTVKQWRFRPALRNGQAVVAWMTVPIEYRNPQSMNGANP
jgi:TonB family protein